MNHTILFTLLKIILLQYFQFSIFSNNKFNPNRPIEQSTQPLYKKKIYNNNNNNN